jgi:hypothetical protein
MEEDTLATQELPITAKPTITIAIIHNPEFIITPQKVTITVVKDLFLTTVRKNSAG